MSKSTLKAILAASVLLLGANAASAGTDAVRAEAFFNAISGGNPETVTSFYADKAEFHWVGGPLAGIYKGKAQIKGVWGRFGNAAGKLNHKTLELSESENGPISTVTARVNFIGPKEVPVKFVLMFKDGKIVNQIWQVDKGESYTAAKAPGNAPAPAAPERAEQRTQGAEADQQAAAPQPTAPNPAEAEEIAAVEDGQGDGPAPADGDDQAAPQDAKAPAPGPAAAQDPEAAPQAAQPPVGAVGPAGAAPSKKFVKKAEKKVKRGRYDDEGYGEEAYGYEGDYGHWAPRRHRYGHRFHGGHRHGGY